MKLWAFKHRRDAERATELARQTPEGPLRRPPQPGGGTEFWFQTRLAKTGGSGITARSSTTAGSGTVTLQYLAGTTITASSETLTVYNWSATAAAATTYVWVHQDSLGTWWVIGEDC